MPTKKYFAQLVGLGHLLLFIFRSGFCFDALHFYVTTRQKETTQKTSKTLECHSLFSEMLQCWHLRRVILLRLLPRKGNLCCLRLCRLYQYNSTQQFFLLFLFLSHLIYSCNVLFCYSLALAALFFLSFLSCSCLALRRLQVVRKHASQFI